MNEPVITLKGACEAKPGSTPPPGCITTLTREQFEKLTTALQPPERGPVPPEIKRRFATQYAKLLILSDAARQLGLENNPRVQQIFHFAQNQILSEALSQHYMDEFAHPSDQQIQDYYNQNVKKYKEVTLQRIIVPVIQGSPDKPKPAEAEQKAFVDKIRERWVAGEDPTKLQAEAMEKSEVKSTPPDINVGARRPGSLPDAHEAVFDLKPGEISPVYSDQAAFYIYKVVSTRQVPLSEVKAQISSTLQREMYNDKLKQVQSAVTPVLNDAYFGPEQPPSVPSTIIHPGPPGAPPAAAPEVPAPNGGTTPAPKPEAATPAPSK